MLSSPHLPRRVRACAAGLVVLALAACSPAGAAGPGEPLRPVTVVLDWTPNTNHSGLYLARDRGYFADAGLDVTIVEPGEASGAQLVAAGRAQFAFSVAEGLVPARGQGADIVSVAAVIQHNTSSLLSLTSSGIERPRDLEGKRYGSYGSKLESALIGALVTCDGGDPAKVEMPPLVSEDFRIGLTEGQYDAAWVFDAWDTIRLRDVDGLDVSTLAFADHTDCIPDWYTPLIATSGELVRDDPALVRSFVGAISHGYQDAIAEPDAAADAILAAAPELEPALVEASAAWLAERYTDDPARWGAQDRRVWDEFVAFLVDHDLIDAGFDTDAAWTDEFLPRP